MKEPLINAALDAIVTAMRLCKRNHPADQPLPEGESIELDRQRVFNTDGEIIGRVRILAQRQWDQFSIRVECNMIPPPRIETHPTASHLINLPE
jgi:hypothetical protein